MQKLAKREEQIMQALWTLEKAFVKEIIEYKNSCAQAHSLLYRKNLFHLGFKSRIMKTMLIKLYVIII